MTVKATMPAGRVSIIMCQVSPLLRKHRTMCLTQPSQVGCLANQSILVLDPLTFIITGKEELQGNTDGIVELDIESAILAIQGSSQFISLDVPFEYLDEEEIHLREMANSYKAAAIPIELKRRSVVQEREYLKGKLEEQLADSLSKSDAFVTAAGQLASSSLKAHEIKDSKSRFSSAFSGANLQHLEMQVALAELQADIYRDRIQMQRNSWNIDSVSSKIADKEEKAKHLSEEITKHEVLKEQLGSSAKALADELKVCCHEELILRRKIEELKLQHQASLVLIRESQAKLADATRRLNHLDSQYKIYMFQFVLLESRMTAVVMCRKQKRLQEKIRRSLNDLLGNTLCLESTSVLPTDGKK